MNAKIVAAHRSAFTNVVKMIVVTVKAHKYAYMRAAGAAVLNVIHIISGLNYGK